MTERRSKRSAAVEDPTVVADEAMDDAPMQADVETAADAPEATANAPEAAADAPEAAADAPEATVMATEAAPTADEAPATDEAPDAGMAPPAEVASALDAPVEAAGGEETAAAAEAEAEPDAAEPVAAAVAEPPAVTERPARTRDAKAAPEGQAPPPGPRGLKVRYQSEVIPALIKQFEYANPNQVPRVDKIVVNIGIGEALTNAKAIDAASGDLTQITGQKPIVQRARRSIAQFKIRAGNPIGLKVTLRGQRMWDFLERLTMLALPRIRDFRGTPSRSFDGRGNYTLGLREQIAFPEIDYDKVDRLRGLEVSIVTTAKSDEESKRLLELLGMPFAS